MLAPRLSQRWRKLARTSSSATVVCGENTTLSSSHTSPSLSTASERGTSDAGRRYPIGPERFRHVLCRGLRGRATHRHTGRRQLCPLRRQHVAGRLQIIVTGLAVVRLSLCPRLVSPGSYEAAGQIGPLPRPQDALYEPERRWARYADHRILHLIVAERIFYRQGACWRLRIPFASPRLPSNRCNSLCLRRGQRENPNWTQAS